MTQPTKIILIALLAIIVFFVGVRVACAQDTTIVYEVYDETLPDTSHGADALIIPATFDLSESEVYILSGGAVGLGYSFWKEADYETGIYIMPAAIFTQEESTYLLSVGVALTLNSLVGGVIGEYGPTFGYSYQFFTTNKSSTTKSHQLFFAIPLTR